MAAVRPKGTGTMHIKWRGLELPSVVQCDTTTLTSTYGKFTAEPFERGFGNTIGNSLRRVLLSSLENENDVKTVKPRVTKYFIKLDQIKQKNQ